MLLVFHFHRLSLDDISLDPPLTVHPLESLPHARTLRHSISSPFATAGEKPPARAARHHPTPRARVYCCSPSRHEDQVLSAISAYLEERGRSPLALLGEHLRTMGLSLPEKQSLSQFVAARPHVLTLSGSANSRKVGLAGRSTADALAAAAADVLRAHGPMTAAELKIRLSEGGRHIPALSTLLRRRGEMFAFEDGAVSARGAPARDGGAPAPLVRLRALALPSAIDAPLAAAAARAAEVVAIDLDNKAFALERAVHRAACTPGVLVLAFCSRAHNPRLSESCAAGAKKLASEGRMRLVMPTRDTKNAADFVMSFWMGWVHAQASSSTKFTLISTDMHLERTVVDTLRREGRSVSVADHSTDAPC
ncbi:hypothetical protein AB1Y20_016306 [Prymnesium parvum]|uniref:DUF218 domain-containing protein n=1 Tax=Prymnesium parvum TaxID=97485 RepID=A0AB34IDT2_PRYPA